MTDSNSSTAESSEFMNSGSRQPTKRMVPTEFTNANHIIQPGDGDQDPKFLITPAGAGANRVMLTGVVTDIEDVGSDQAYLRMRCTDVAGNAFLTYAGQYQPDARNDIRELEAPETVQVIGKPNTLETDDGGVLTSIRPEVVNVISQSEFLALCAENAQHTIKRLTGEQGHEFFHAEADDLYGDEFDEEVYEAAVETLERVAEEAGPEGEEDELSRSELEEMDYDELRGLAAEFEDINGNASANALVDALSGEPVPA